MIVDDGEKKELIQVSMQKKVARELLIFILCLPLDYIFFGLYWHLSKVFGKTIVFLGPYIFIQLIRSAIWAVKVLIKK